MAVGVSLSPVTAAESGPAAKPNLLPADGFHWKQAVERRREARKKAIRQARRRRRARVAVPAAL